MTTKFTKLLSDGKFLIVKDTSDNKPFVVGTIYLEETAQLICDLLQSHYDHLGENQQNEK